MRDASRAVMRRLRETRAIAAAAAVDLRSATAAVAAIDDRDGVPRATAGERRILTDIAYRCEDVWASAETVVLYAEAEARACRQLRAAGRR
jgi:hypothetical protein